MVLIVTKLAVLMPGKIIPENVNGADVNINQMYLFKKFALMNAQTLTMDR
jgi:hypothetical protein